MTYEKHSHEYRQLEAFFFHAWLSRWEKVPLDSKYWAETLDAIGIPWQLQNLLAGRAYEDRQSGFIYFSTVLSQELANIK